MLEDISSSSNLKGGVEDLLYEVCCAYNKNFFLGHIFKEKKGIASYCWSSSSSSFYDADCRTSREEMSDANADEPWNVHWWLVGQDRSFENLWLTASRFALVVRAYISVCVCVLRLAVYAVAVCELCGYVSIAWLWLAVDEPSFSGTSLGLALVQNPPHLFCSRFFLFHSPFYPTYSL